MAALLLSLGQSFGENDRSKYAIAEIYTSMREHVLTLSDEKINGLEGKPIWAVLMEAGYPEAAVTLVAVADGAASLYFSNGGGMIGAGEYADVYREVMAFVKLSEEYLKHMKKVDRFLIVTPGCTTFYVVTSKGVFAYTSKEEDLKENRDKLSRLFYQGHEVITQMLIVDEARRIEQEQKEFDCDKE